MSLYSKPIYVVEEIGTVVTRVATKLGISINYLFGHLREITIRLQELADSTTLQDAAFPLVALFTDIPIRENQPNGMYGTATLNLIIATFTKQEYTAQERLDNSFKPKLYPIKNEFLKQIELSQRFQFPGEVQYTAIDRYYYGSMVDSKNQFNDFIDCIEIQNLQVIIKNKPC